MASRRSVKVTSAIFALGLVAMMFAPSPASASVVCEQFQVGTPKWQSCVEDAATGGVKPGKIPGSDTKSGEQTNPAGDVACSEFQVGTPKWTKCVEDAATGGGLMPWIVIVPLGIMMVGMAVLFSWQAFRGDKTFSTGGVGSTAAVWLIFIGLIELASGGGAAVAASRADGPGGGYQIAAIALLATGAALMIAGIVVAMKARGKKKIAVEGLSGTGTVVSANPTGVTINDAPVLSFQLDIEAPGIMPFRTQVRATMPFLAFGQITGGTKLPVKIDREDNSKVLIDWDNWNPTPMVPSQPGAPTPGTP